MDNLLLLPPVLGVVGLVAAFVIYRMIVAYPAGSGLVAEIAEQILSIVDPLLPFVPRGYRTKPETVS